MNGVTSLPMSSWPVGRKVAAGVFAVAGLTTLACAAIYVSAVLFLVLNKAKPEFADGLVAITLENPVERREFEYAVKLARHSVE